MRESRPVDHSRVVRSSGAAALRHDFPLLTAALDLPMVVLFAVFCLAVFLGFLSLHYSLTALALLTGYAALYFERRYVEQWLFSPLFLCIIPNLLTAVGVAFFTMGTGGQMEGSIFWMQVNYLGGFVCMCGGYFLTRGRQEIFPVNTVEAQGRASIMRPLVNIGWVLYLLTIMAAWLAAITGVGDRGHVGEYFVENRFGWWSVFQAFKSTYAVGLLLFPAIYANSPVLVRAGLLITLALHFILMFASGSREQFLAPAVFLCVGMYIFRGGRKSRLQWQVLLLTPVALGCFYLLNLYRDTQGFNDTRMINVRERLGAVSQVRESGALADHDFLVLIGQQFIEVSDAVIYANTPSAIPHAGWENIEAVPWTWVPYFIYQNRPMLIDGNSIVGYYTNNYNDRSSTKVSLEGDLYRRFGVMGVLLGSFFFGLIYGLVVRFVFYVMNFRNAVMGILLYLLLLTFFRSGLKNQSMLTVWWQLAYEIPKNFVPLFVLSVLLSSKLGLKVLTRWLPQFGALERAPSGPPKQWR